MMNGEPPRLNTRLAQIDATVENLMKGQITTAEYRDFMENTEDFLLQTLEEVRNYEIPDDMKDEMKQEMEMGTLGIEAYIASIDLLKLYLKEKDTGLLEEGRRKARKANELMNAALAMNWKSFQSFHDSTEEYLKSTGLSTD